MKLCDLVDVLSSLDQELDVAVVSTMTDMEYEIQSIDMVEGFSIPLVGIMINDLAVQAEQLSDSHPFDFEYNLGDC
jgi:hypothetical protein